VSVWSTSSPPPPSGFIPAAWCPSVLLIRDVAAEFKPQAFLCTGLNANPLDIPRWYIRRWSTEVTFAEVRRHLGVETQRQWSDPAIARTTPALLGLFSLIALWADELHVARQLTPLTTR
jgi:hypothetical protein